MDAALDNPRVVAARTGLRAARWLVAALIALHVGLALWWGTVVPLGEGPDEPGHFRYALFLARTGQLPVQRADATASDVPGEGHQPPLAYWLLQPAVRWLPADARTVELGEAPDFLFRGGDEPAAYFRSSADIWPYAGVARAWHLARASGALLGGVTVACVYALGRRVFGAGRLGQWVPPAAAALVALNPQFIFAHALVSNDPLLIALSSGLLYVSVALLDRATSWRWAAGAGLVLGLMLITKQSAVALLPVPLLALLLRGNLRRAVADGLLLLAVAALVSGWWFVRNLGLYGDPLGLAAFQETFATGDFRLGSWLDWRNGLWNLLRSSWGNFGWLSLPLNDGAYHLLAVVLLLALIGLLSAASRGWWSGQGRVALLLGVALVMVLAWTVSFARVAGMVAWQGRFLFPAIPAFALLLAVGLGAALPGRAALWTLVGLLGVLALAVPPGLIAPAYPSYVVAPLPDGWGNTYGRFDVGWKRGVELRNVVVPSAAAQGSTLEVELTWHALEQLDRPWSVFVHLVGPGKTILDESNGQPMGGAFPTDGWTNGDWIRDRQSLRVANAPPGQYQLWIGLWDPETGERLGMYDRDGTLAGDRVEVGPITIAAR